MWPALLVVWCFVSLPLGIVIGRAMERAGGA